MSDENGFSKGLAGVVADATSVSQVQGEAGRLIYRGISIEDLAEKSTFEECVYFSLYGKMPTQNELNKFVIQMKSHRVLPKTVEAVIKAAPRSAHPMAVLQAAVAAMGFDENPVNLKSEELNCNLGINKMNKLNEQKEINKKFLK